MRTIFWFLFLATLIQSVPVIGQGNIRSVKIGNQVWMGENLAVKTFRNGDKIPHARSREEWIKAGEDCTPAWTYYENNESIGKRVGILYNWYAVIDPRGLAPKNWRVPTYDDFNELSNFLGGEFEAGKKLKSTKDWFRNGHGNNSSGFNAIGGGNRDKEGYFFYIVRVGLWWTVSEYDYDNAWYFYVDYDNDALKKYGGGKPMGMSVRCIKE